MKKNLSIGVHVPSVSVSSLASGKAYARFFQDVEAMGLDAIWVEDRILHPAHLADSLTLLSWAAANTQRVRLGTAVLILNLRQAPIVARQISTLDHLSGGRISLGVSIGGRPEEYKALGLPIDKRVTLFRENIKILRELFNGLPVTHHGKFFDIEDAVVKPAVQVPILIGAIAEKAIRRAGELGDGWIMGPFGSIKEFRAGWKIARAGARLAGRKPDDLIAGRLLYVAIDENYKNARTNMGKFLHGYYGSDFDVDKHAIIGSAEYVRDCLQEHVNAGITHLMLGLPSLDSAQLRDLAEKVAPSLR